MIFQRNQNCHSNYFLVCADNSDCYVAVAGLPGPRTDHAVAMSRFARDVLSITQRLTKQLELTLVCSPHIGEKVFAYNR
jgi:hypothetical protein